MPINSSFSNEEANITISVITSGAAPASPSSVIMNKKSCEHHQEPAGATSCKQQQQGGMALVSSSAPLSSEEIFYAMMNGESIDPTSATNSSGDYSSSAATNSHPAPAASNMTIGMSSLDSSSRLTLDVLTDALLLEDASRHTSTKSIMKSSRSCASKANLDDEPVDQSESDNHAEEEDDMVGALASACWASTSNADPFDATTTQPPKDDDEGEDASSSFTANEDSVFYRFAHHVRTQYELREKAEKFRDCVDIRDRTYNLTVYKNCFIGSEAVDAMIYTGLVTTREEGVALGRQLAKEQNLFKHVRGRHLFKDEYIFYKFRHGNGDESSTFNLGSASSHSDSDSVADSDDGTVSSNNDTDKFGIEDSADFKSVSSKSVSSHRPNKRLTQMATLFRESADVRDRKFRMKTFKQCFVGREIVDALVNKGVVSTRKEAVQFGRTLAKELDLFEHVTGDHAFCDEYLFFRFNDSGVQQDKRVLPIALATL